MKMIVTTEKGQAAAEAVDPDAGEVSEIKVKVGEASVFVVKVPRGAPYFTISMKMEELLDHTVKDPAAREKITCIVMPDDQSIEHIPEEAMRGFGWKRA